MVFMDASTERASKSATLGSYAGGLLCAGGWYVFVWALLESAHHHALPGAYWAPGVVGSVSLVMLNLVHWEAVTDDGGSLAGDGPSGCARAWVTASFVLMFCAVGAALWILVQDLAREHVWSGGAIAVAVQNVLIFAAGFIFRVVRRHAEHSL